MDEKRQMTTYIIVSDECSSFQYLESAFKMLAVKVHVCQADALSATLNKHQDEDLIVFGCQHHEKLLTQHQAADKKPTCLMVTDGKINPKSSLMNLVVPFSLSQFKAALYEAKLQSHTYTLEQQAVFKNLIGSSEAIQKIKNMITQVAASSSNILILGESGTGKNVIASCVHQLSERKNKTFVPLNCGAIPSELIESELFGHEKGAFTGAITRRPGRFEIADKGTLFLDEIGDMPLPMQVKLLRVLQEGIIERVGSTQPIEVDVRLIAATNQHLEHMITEHRFREDLYYRLNVIPITVPALRERPRDIPPLIEQHHQKVSKRFPNETVFSEEAIQMLCEYDWPGNIRELANFVERMVVLHHDELITAKHIEEQFTKSHLRHHITIPTEAEQLNFKEYLATVEQQIIKLALSKSNGIISAAAKYLNIGKASLNEKIKKYQLRSAD